MAHRHLDYPPDASVDDVGLAALDDLLDRGDLHAWSPLLRAVRADPLGPLADSILEVCAQHEMYGTSALSRIWIERLRARSRSGTENSLSDLRRHRGRTQHEVAVAMGISQSDVSKVERRSDVRLSTLRSYLKAIGGHLELSVSFDGNDGGTRLRVGGEKGR